jgi:uncharacterized protein (TIGR03066 family)
MPRPILLIIVTFLIFSQEAFADGSSYNQSAKLIGWWEEYSPSSNLVHFTQDGTVRLLLKKGEIGNLHSLDGTWKITRGSNIQMVFSLNGKTLVRDGTLSFQSDEMLLIDKSGNKTRHRRHSGAIPEKYLW